MLIFTLKNGYSLEQNFKDTLRQAYQYLGYSHHGLDYPGNKEILDRCIKNQIEPCLRVYHKVKEAKQVILTYIGSDRQKIFQFTVDTIMSDCDQQAHQPTCFGAVVALYFFNEAQEDDQLFKVIAKATPEVFGNLFLKRFEWYFNRPCPDKWINFIQSARKLTAEDKAQLITYFKQAKQENYTAFGIMLLKLNSSNSV